MKKYILSPLCSALVVPGLGQVLNNNIKKGLCILATVFILLVVGIVKLALIIDSLLKGMELNSLDTGVMIERLRGEDFFILWALLIIFGIVWIYSVLEAFWTGKKIENQAKMKKW